MDTIVIGNNTFSTLVAVTKQEKEIGLMGKVWPPPIMTFAYRMPGYNKFWMMNTPSPLDIVFASKNKVIGIYEGVPNSLSAIGPDSPTDLVIELPKGYCVKYDIKVGDDVKFEPTIKTLNKLVTHY